MTTQSVIAKLEIQWSRIEDMLCSAWEGGSNYWLECYDYRIPDPPQPAGVVEYRYQNALYPGGACLCRIAGDSDDPSNGRKLELTQDKLISGLQTFAEKCPSHFADFMAENDDATTADCFLQCCLLGDVVYG
jgi:hypothetical protein